MVEGEVVDCENEHTFVNKLGDADCSAVVSGDEIM
jgi:hypothetical protein